MLKNNYIPVLTLRGIGSTIPSPKKREQNTQTTLEILPQTIGEPGMRYYDVLYIPLRLTEYTLSSTTSLAFKYLLLSKDDPQPPLPWEGRVSRSENTDTLCPRGRQPPEKPKPCWVRIKAIIIKKRRWERQFTTNIWPLHLTKQSHFLEEKQELSLSQQVLIEAAATGTEQAGRVLPSSSMSLHCPLALALLNPSLVTILSCCLHSKSCPSQMLASSRLSWANK